MEELKTSEEWSKIYSDWIVIDPDGWDRLNYDYSWKEELITITEYRKRLSSSTIMSVSV